MAVIAQEDVLSVLEGVGTGHNTGKLGLAAFAFLLLHFGLKNGQGVQFFLNDIHLILIVSHEYSGLSENHNMVASPQMPIHVRVPEDDP